MRRRSRSDFHDAAAVAARRKWCVLDASSDSKYPFIHNKSVKYSEFCRVWFKRKFYTSGKWKRNFESSTELQNCASDPIFCSNYSWDIEMNCKWKLYEPSFVKRCLQSVNLIVLGDSRGRQIFRSLEQRIHGEKVIDATPWRGQNFTAPKFFENEETNLKFYWANYLDNLEELLKKNLQLFKSNSKNFVLGEHFLWTVQNGFETSADSNCFYREKSNLLVFFEILLSTDLKSGTHGTSPCQ